jgi:TatA/E family protein of Tat protein translocase
MTGNLMGGDGLIVIVVALVVLIGGSQLPKIARNIGLAGKEFRKAQSEAEEEERAKAGSRSAGADLAPPPVALPPTPSAGAASSAPVATSAAATSAGAPPASGDESITLTPAQLEALLKAREEQARSQPGSN